MKVVHSWLKEYLGESLPDAKKIEELLTFHSFEVEGVEEVGGETVIDVDILPNRSSDCLCHRGIARELAAVLSTNLEYDPLQEEVNLTETEKIKVDIQDAEACPRFTASLITGITVKDSPKWLQRRLEALGVRSINNIVDATNYIMYALGEPLHAYDADLFPQANNVWNIVVRPAKANEKVSLLSEGGKDEDRIIECIRGETLIIDGSSDTPIGLAGVKGGRFAGVHAGTKNIIIEAAHFNPTTTRKTARRLGIVIDASKRFENEPSRELPPFAQKEVIKLITDIAGGDCEGYVDVYLEKKQNPTVQVGIEKTNSLLGLSLSVADMAGLVSRTGAQVSVKDDSFIEAVAPLERTDLFIEEDYIEEIGRLYGLSNITSIPPKEIPVSEINLRHYYGDVVRTALLGQGFSEVITSSFHKKGNIQLLNALASDKSYVRSNLYKNIEAVLDKNFTHCDLLGLDAIRVFEIGTVFTEEENNVKEHVSVALGVRTKGNGYSGGDDKVLNETITALRTVLQYEFDWKIEKGIAETNFSEALQKLSTPTSYLGMVKQPDVQYKAPSLYPAIARDIALWVSADEQVAMVSKELTEAAGDLLVRHHLFDTFSKDGKTSYAFRFVFQSFEKTLTDEEINTVMEVVYKAAEKNGWEVR